MRSLKVNFIYILVILAMANSALAQVSDDFSAPDLNTGLWSFVDPVGDSSYNISDGLLTLSVNGGTAHDLWKSGNGAVRLMQPSDNVDFELEAKFESTPTEQYQIQGLLVEESPGNYVRFDYYSNGSSLYFFGASLVNNSPTVRGNITVTDQGGNFWIKVARVGNTWTAFYSQDGQNWTSAFTFDHSLAATQTGVYGGNAGANPAFDVFVDYFFNTASTIVPEDFNNPSDVTAPVISAILATPTTDSATLSWTTDEMALGRIAYGLTSALELGSVSGTGYALGQDLTLSTLSPETTYYYQISSEDGAGNIAQSAVSSLQTLALPNVLPSITLTSPIDGSAVMQSDVVALVANASDSDGNVVQVEFLVDNNVVSTVNSAPWESTWSSGIPGLHELKARATDNDGQSTLSNIVSVTVEVPDTTPPVISGLVVSTSANSAELTWTTDELALGRIGYGLTSALELGEIAGSGYALGQTLILPSLNPETNYYYQIFSEDNSGNISQTDVATFLTLALPNVLPSVTLTSPIDGSTALQGAVVALTADASDTDGTITQVEFLVDGNVVDTLVAAPWETSWSNGSLGLHALTARATDNSGGITTSGAVSVTVIVPDSNPPVISGLIATPASTTAEVFWSTDELALGRVNYGLTLALELGELSGAGYALEQTLTVSGLDPETTYYYQVTSEDVAGNIAQSAVSTLLTLAAPNSLPTVFLASPLNGATVLEGDIVALTANASDSDGTVSQVEFLVDGSVVATINSAPWESSWSGALPGQYSLAARATDDAGGITTSVANTVTVSSLPGASGLISDDFSSPALDTSLWTFVDPVGGSSYSQVNGLLILAVSGGTSHDLWQSGNDAVRIMQPAANVDFEVEAKFESTPTQRHQIQGLLIEESPGNYLRFDYYSDGSALNIFSASFVNNSPTIRGSSVVTDQGGNFWIKVTRTGNTWNSFYSQDGQNWTPAFTFNHTMNVTQSGVYGGNEGSPSPAFDVLVDYFFDTAAPVFPEDGGDPSDTTPPVISGLLITPASTSAELTWTTDELASGGVAYGLTSGLELGVISSAGYAMGQTLVLPSLTPETTYYFQVSSEDGSGNISQESIATLVTLILPNVFPAVVLTSPAEGATLFEGDAVPLTANASDSDGNVALVEFLVDDVVVSTLVAAPWESTWSDGALGQHTITARATDNAGDITTSAAVTVTVVAPDLTSPVISGLAVTPAATLATIAWATDELALGRVAYGLTAALELGEVSGSGFALAQSLVLPSLNPDTTYYYQVTSEDAAGNIAQTVVATLLTLAVPNNLPSISLSSPIDGITVLPEDIVALVANAADSDGTVIQVEFLVDGAVVATLNSAPWESTWSGGLLGQHTLTARATDDVGGTTTSAPINVTVSLGVPSGVVVSDDFSAPVLDSALWNFVDPVGDSSYSQANGLLTLSVAGGTAHDLWNTGNDAVRVVQPITDVDFELEAKFESTPTTQFQIQGLLVEQSPGNYVRVDYYSDGLTLNLFSASFVNNSPTVRGSIGITDLGGNFWIKAARAGNTWTIFHSQDGQNWATAFTFDFTMTATLAGVYGGNAGNSSPAFDVLVDYFFDTANPIFPEDGADPSDITPPVISAINVTPAPTAASVSWTTDEMARGRVTYGLTSSLELGVISSAGYDMGHTLTLTSLTPETAYFYRVESEDGSGNIAQTVISTLQTTAVPNVLPIVALTSPADSSSVLEGAVVALVVDASDSDGTVVQVEFLVGNTVVSTLVAAPWETTWSGGALGEHTLTARATDNDGATKTSVGILVTVVVPDLTPPVISGIVVSPASTSATISFITDELAIGRVAYGLTDQYELGLIATESATINHMIALSGLTTETTYFYRIEAEDLSGNLSQEPASQFLTVPVPNQIPVVTLTTPLDGDTFSEGDNVLLAADVVDSDGSIVQVEFIVEGSVVATLNTAPWETTWTAPAAGAYSIAVRATDDQGALGESPIISINVFGTGERTYVDLQAYYLFRVGEGSVVPDLSGVAPLLNLEITNVNSVNWLPGGGIDLVQPTLLHTLGAATKINESCRQSNEVTIEAWVDPATIDQSGPARIVSLSGDPFFRNVTLAHGLWGTQPTTLFDTRLRTTATSLNGVPSTTTPAGSLTGDLQQVVYTRATNGDISFYVDGLEVISSNIGGDLSNWDMSFPLNIGAEAIDGRNWLGAVHLVAVYNRAITSFEVQQNFSAGPSGGNLPTMLPVVQLDVVQAGQDVKFDQTVNISANVIASSSPVARVDFLAGGVVIGSDFTDPFQFDWVDPAVGNHLLQAVAVDDIGIEGSSLDIPVYVSVPVGYEAAQLQSDDFFAANLNGLWQVADGTGSAIIAQANGNVTVVQPGFNQDGFGSADQFVFVGQTELNTDVAVEAKISTSDFVGQAFAGIRLQGTGNEAVQFVGRHNNGSWEIAWGISDGVVFSDLGSLAIPGVADGLWLQIRRAGNSWRMLYSTNGLNWVEAALVNRTLVLNSSGWVTGSNASGANTTSALDYFFNLDSPVFPEDQAGGDGVGPVISSISVLTNYDNAQLTFVTDELALVQVDYGLTTQYELGTIVGSGFEQSHFVDFTGLSTGEQYHFRIRALDIPGNLTVSVDDVFATDILGVVSVGPVAGDVYREASRGMTGESWRITDPDALAAGAAEFLPNPVLTIDLPDLTYAIRAELVIDRWGGHPGTSDKQVRFNDQSWLHLPEIASIPSSSPECYVYQDNIVVDLPLNQLQAGANIFEGLADEQTCYSFDWSQWGWYGVVVRVYYDSAAVPQPSGQITSPLTGDVLGESVVIDVTANAASGVAEVLVLGRYNGVDVDGDGVFNEWQGHYTRGIYENNIHLRDIVGSDNIAPFSVPWNTTWVPDQDPGSMALQARIRDNDGWWKVTDIVDGLSLDRSNQHVRFYSVSNLAPTFWVRTGKSKTADLIIPSGDDLSIAIEAQLMVRTWNGIDQGVVDVNGLWSNSNFGKNHFYSFDTIDLDPGALISGTNQITFSSNTIEHGVEVLWPGPMVAVRYGTVVAPPEISPPGGVYAASVDVILSADPGSEIYFTLDGSVPDSGSTLYSGPLQITNNGMLQAVSYTPGFLPSSVQSASFSISGASDGRAIDGLQALYLFDEGSGGTVLDATGLFPALDLTVADQNAVTWSPGGGLVLDTPTSLSTTILPERVLNSIRSTGEFTIETWITPATDLQAGPARIFSISDGAFSRNFTMGHGLSDGSSASVYSMRVRTTDGDDNGMPPIETPSGAALASLQHLVATGDTLGNYQIFIDGVLVASGTRTGDFSNWNQTMPLLLGAEADGTRNWLGTYHLVSLYSRALSEIEIQGNFAYGPNGALAIPSSPTVAITAPVVPSMVVLGADVPVTVTASDPDGDVALVEVFANGVLLFNSNNPALNELWQPATIGTYQLVARATDAGGRQSLSDPVTVAIHGPGATDIPVAYSIDFAGGLTDPNVWTFVDPQNDASLELSNQAMRITIPGGISHDVWAAGITAPRLEQNLAAGDFDLELKIDSAPSSAYQMNGLVFTAADGNWLRFEIHHDGIQQKFFAARSNGSSPVILADIAITNNTGRWLRVSRIGGSWNVDISTDGVVWATGLTPTALSLVPDKVAIFAGNAGDNPPAFTAAYDYFFDLKAPVDPEDGEQAVDTVAPEIANIVVTNDLATATALVSCTTDEGAIGYLEYGLDATYGQNVAPASYQIIHNFTLENLVADQTYHYQIRVTDSSGNTSLSGDQTFTTTTGPAGLVIVVWHGLNQRVGHLGDGQADFNVLGNISPIADISTFVYSVNGGLEIPLNWGSQSDGFGDWRRLASTGDFNADIPITEFQLGSNSVLLKAVDINGIISTETVNVMMETGSASLPYAITWNGVTNPQDAGQYIDGIWAREAGGIRTVEVGYDRLFLVGETNWQDYEILVPITIHSVLQGSPLSHHPGLGLIMRFTGHVVGGHRNWPEAQPKWGYQPFGAIGWLRWRDDLTGDPTIQFYRGDNDDVQNFGLPAKALAEPETLEFGPSEHTKDFGLVAAKAGSNIWMKMRCETLADSPDGFGVSLYSYKIWDSSVVEPANWSFQVVQTSEFALRQGGVALVAHNVDATFGDVTVTPLSAPALVLAGDVNDDEVVDMADAELVMAHVVGDQLLDLAQINRGDMGFTPGIDVHDAALIAQLAGGEVIPAAESQVKDELVMDMDWGEFNGGHGQLEVPLVPLSFGGGLQSLYLELKAPGIAEWVKDVESPLSGEGLMFWRASGDTLRIAFASPDIIKTGDLVLNLVLDMADTYQPPMLQGEYRIDGGKLVKMSALELTSVPTQFVLGNNYPNPFNPITNIVFELPASSDVRLQIYDVRGRMVRSLISETLTFGRHTVVWDGTDNEGRSLSGGVYLYRLQTRDNTATRKMLLVK